MARRPDASNMSQAKQTPSREKGSRPGDKTIAQASTVACTPPSTNSSSSPTTKRDGGGDDDTPVKRNATPPSSGPSKKASTAGPGGGTATKGGSQEKKDEGSRIAVVHERGYADSPTNKWSAASSLEAKTVVRFGSAAMVAIPSPAATATATKGTPIYNGGEIDDDNGDSETFVTRLLAPLSLSSKMTTPTAQPTISRQSVLLSKKAQRNRPWDLPGVKRAFEEGQAGPTSGPSLQGPTTHGLAQGLMTNAWPPARNALTMVANSTPPYTALTAGRPFHAANPNSSTIATGLRPVDVADRHSRGPRAYQPMDVAVNPGARNMPVSEEKRRDNLARGFSAGYRGNTLLPQNRSADIPPEQNCGLYVTGLPADATNKLVVDSIRDCGRIWCTHIVPPNPKSGHAYAAAKIVFFDRAGAERFMAKHAGYGNWEVRYQPPLPGDEIGDGYQLRQLGGERSWVGSPYAEPFVPGSAWGKENMPPLPGDGDGATTNHSPSGHATEWNLTSPRNAQWFSSSSPRRVQLSPEQYPLQPGFHDPYLVRDSQHHHQKQQQQEQHYLQSRQLSREGRPLIHAVWNRIRYAEDRKGNNERSRVLLISGDPEFVNPRSLYEYLSSRIEFQTESVRVVKVVRVPVAPVPGAGARIGGGSGSNSNSTGSIATGTPATVLRQLVEFRFCSFRCQADAAKMCLEGEHPNKVLVHYGRDPCDVEKPEQAFEDGQY